MLVFKRSVIIQITLIDTHKGYTAKERFGQIQQRHLLPYGLCKPCEHLRRAENCFALFAFLGYILQHFRGEIFAIHRTEPVLQLVKNTDLTQFTVILINESMPVLNFFILKIQVNIRTYTASWILFL